MQELTEHLINASGYYKGLTLNPVNKSLPVRHMHELIIYCASWLICLIILHIYILFSISIAIILF